MTSGQKPMADSLPVVIASNQTTLAVDSELPAAAALADGTANPTTPIVGDALHVFNGTTWDRARGDTTNGLDVDVTRVQGTVTVSGTVTANAGTGTLAVAAAGDVGHDGVNSGNPFQLGAEAIAHGTNPTAVAAADRTRLYANRHGVLFVIGGHPNPFSEESHFTTAQTDVALKTISAGTKIVITSHDVSIDESTTVGVGWRLGFGSTTLPATGTGVAGILDGHGGMVPGGGKAKGDGSGILGVGADGEDVRLTCDVPTNGSIKVIIKGYTVES